MKSEPDAFSIDDLAKVGQEPWSGVRNYQARNFMWKDMRVGDGVFFYHSNAKVPGVVGGDHSVPLGAIRAAAVKAASCSAEPSAPSSKNPMTT